MARLHSCNILQIAPDACHLWQFDAKGGGFALDREHHGQSLPSRAAAKSWSSLWQPKLNVAWLPPENIFFRVIQLPKSSFDETLAMVELQLEKLSPMPVAQIVWTIHVLSAFASLRRDESQAGLPRQSEATVGDLQTIIVVIAARDAVEEFLGKLEGQGYLADRLEAPFLDQLEMDGSSRQPEAEAEAWIYPEALGGKNAALVAWWSHGGLRNLSLIVLPPAGDRVKSLKDQLAQLSWAGELEGWLTAPPRWHLVAGTAVAADWEQVSREGLGEPVQIARPLPAAELAARTAQRAASAATDSRAALLPAEFSARYHQQFVDRLWLRGLVATGILYAIGVAIYFCATYVLSVRIHRVEQEVAAISLNYTNALRLKARCEVLRNRQELKYAALDCWKIAAEQLPPGLSLQRLSFADGQKLALNGTASPDQIAQITDFSEAMRKAKMNGQPMFAPEGGDQLSYRQSGNTVSWNFSLVLKHAGEAQ